MNQGSPIQLIAGLGNPGTRYLDTRHNAGTWLVEQLVQLQQLNLQFEPKFYALGAQAHFQEHACHCIIPNTYMNHSGHTIKVWTQFYKIAPQCVLVVHDDLDLSPGISRFKHNGSAGGHNGLKSIITQLGRQDFWRLRIGIGHPGQHSLVHDYVLSRPSQADYQKIQASIQRAIAVLPGFVAGNSQRAQQILHSVSHNSCV